MSNFVKNQRGLRRVKAGEMAENMPLGHDQSPRHGCCFTIRARSLLRFTLKGSPERRVAMSKVKSSKGFTLIEALIAMAMFSVVVLALTSLLYAVINSNRQSSLYSIMTALAKDKVEKVQLQALNSDQTTFGAIGNEALVTIDAQGNVSATGRFTRQVAITNFDIGIPGNVDYKGVDVTVTSLETKRSVTLSTIVAPPAL